MEYFKIVENNNKITILCQDKWDMYQAKSLQKEISKIIFDFKEHGNLVIDLNNIESLDTAGAILLYNFIKELQKYSILKIVEKNNKQKEFINFVDNLIGKENKKQEIYHSLNFIQKVGKYVAEFFLDFWLFIAFIGQSSISFVTYLIYPSKIRFKAIIKGIENAGVHALPIIALTSFLVGIVVAYQSAVQLQKFGANIFIVDMIGVSVTRELAPLITAIVVAGRSGSSYTAQIGAQKITRELDAMKTMGFNLFEFLVLPRIIALMIALPLMIFFADIVGIFGGMVVAKYQMDISYVEFLKRLQSVLALKQLWTGLIKGPAFALLIASIGCFRGFQVSNNTESIGKYTTISVVNAIFLVIACDALFSVVFTKLGV